MSFLMQKDINKTIHYIYIYIHIYIILRNTAYWIVKIKNKNTKRNSERQFQKHFNPIEYVQCPEFSTTPAVFISGTTSTGVNK